MRAKKTAVKQLSKLDAAYIAGIFDGEGCAGISKWKSNYKAHPYLYGVRMIITNTNFPLICWLKEKIGAGCAHQVKRAYKPEWNRSHRYQITGNQARDVLKQLLPFLIVKKEITELVLSFPIHKKVNKQYGTRTEETCKEQAEIYELSKAMNKRGAA